MSREPKQTTQAAQPQEDVSTADVDPAQSSQQPKRKRPQKTSAALAQFTIRNPAWSYIHLSLIPATASAAPDTDALTAHLHIRAALSQFLGLHGTAIPVDILKLDANDVWIRVPREDASAVVIAVGGWVGKAGEGWRVKHSGCWGPGVGAGTGADLFGT